MYDTNDQAVQALKNGQIDGIVVDMPTAFYVAGVQLSDGKIVGTLPTKGTKERFGLVLQKGSGLTTCVNRALDAALAERDDQEASEHLAPEGPAEPEVAP